MEEEPKKIEILGVCKKCRKDFTDEKQIFPFIAIEGHRYYECTNCGNIEWEEDILPF